MSEFLTETVKANFYPPLCLWCEHFSLYTRSPGYSEMTPGSDFDMYCDKHHWTYDQYRSETHYRECILTAANCPDFKASERIVREIQQAQEPKPPKKGRK